MCSFRLVFVKTLSAVFWMLHKENLDEKHNLL